MPRQKKQRLKRRKDGRFACRYKNQWFYSTISDEDAFAQREEYKRLEKQGIIESLYVKGYAEKWLERAFPEVSESTKEGLKIHLNKLYKAVGSMRFSEVRPSDIKSIYSEQYKGLSNSYIKSGRQVFCSLFDAAVADGLIVSNPAREKTAKPQKGREGGHRAITDQEREWINTFCHDHRAYPAIITMLYAGIRPQEAKALKIEKAFDGDTIHITETAHRDGHNQYTITKQGKTKNAIRDIPAFPPVQDALSNKKGLLITTAKGKQITSTTWRNAMDSYRTCMETAINGCHKRWYGKTKEQKKMAEEGTLPPWIEFTVVPYDLRHSFCTWGRDLGVELHTMIEWMGHADAKMIMKIYDEVKDNRSKNEAEKVLKSAFRSQNGSQDKSEEPESVEK